MPCVPAGMPLYSHGVFGCVPLLQFPLASTFQKSGHLGISGGHGMSLLWEYSAYPMKIMAAMSMMIAIIMTTR